MNLLSRFLDLILVVLVPEVLSLAAFLLSLGAGFGASGELFTERRGLEKSMFNTTVVIAFIFALSILATLIAG